jgi:isocitrate lyase
MLKMWSSRWKVTVPHEDFIAKINAIRYAFLELGVDDGIIVAERSEGQV